MQSTIALKETKRAALAEQAARIVQAAEAQSKNLTTAEGARVLRLVAEVRALEEEIVRLHRRRGK